LDALEQAAFKRCAAFGPVGVNPAELSIETAARLDERALHPLFLERHSEVNQTPGVVALLQFHVSEQHAVAAQAAGGAELFDAVHVNVAAFGRKPHLSIF
jgi:hypothetical protein